MMQTEMYVRRDITAILNAVLTAQQDMAGRIHSPNVQLYNAGFIAALRAVAAGFQIDTEYELPLPDEPRSMSNVRVQTAELRLTVARKQLSG